MWNMINQQNVEKNDWEIEIHFANFYTFDSLTNVELSKNKQTINADI